MTRVARHLGLDLGGTNTKWAVVEHDGDDWHTLATRPGSDPRRRRARTPSSAGSPRWAPR